MRLHFDAMCLRCALSGIVTKYTQQKSAANLGFRVNFVVAFNVTYRCFDKSF